MMGCWGKKGMEGVEHLWNKGGGAVEGSWRGNEAKGLPS